MSEPTSTTAPAHGGEPGPRRLGGASRPSGREAASRPLTVQIGHEELVIRRRYATASIVNDILIALWFIVGSVMFFSEAWTEPGTWCFLLGSVELLVRPVIRLGRHIHLRRVGGSPETAHMAPSQDY
ncbi:YrhK family protein [Streptomyces sp. WMMB303]|uniref:YrhK family protein n=1 Tax=Streptomyces sp. WMMB303 TaxID=3034154 RepID=UPI0023EC8F2B|nr:YrhK family protein [Streptomyces sp. WMMB303]MDF4249320.1 YrhK family protein [Streptomyces sp. WMMB303]